MAIKQDDIVVLALARLGGATKKVYSEHIAAEAHRLAPDIFGWELPEYRERGWPDKEKVRIALVRLRSDDGGRLVDGHYAKDTSPDGWKLTPSGATWLNNNEVRVAEALSIERPDIPRSEATRFLKGIKRDPLFKQYLAGDLESATPYQFTDMLNCSPDAAREVIADKFARAQAMANMAKDSDVIRFFDTCGSQFASVLTPPSLSGRGKLA